MSTILIIVLFILVVAIAICLYFYFASGSVGTESFITGMWEGGGTMRLFSQEPWFTEIKEGKKTVEVRVGSLDKFENLAGKNVRIVAYKQPAIKAKVVAVRHYDTLEALIAKEGWKKIAPHVKKDDIKDAMLSIKDQKGAAIYAADRVKEKGGVVAIEFEVLAK